MYDNSRMGEDAFIQPSLETWDAPKWRCHYRVDKEWVSDDPVTGHEAGDREFIEGVGNTLMNSGASIIWERLITLNPSTSATGAMLQAYSSGNAGLGVGISTATAAATQTDLQATTAGSTQRYWKAMQAAYPSHSTANYASSSGARQCQFRAQYTTTEANFAWQEWAISNDVPATAWAANGTSLLNRKVQSLGTKTTSATWTFTVTLALS